MNAVGIDVSKGKSMVAALRPMGEVALLPQEFLHTGVGLEQMAYTILALGEDTRVVMEATGRYHEPVAAALHEYGIYVCVLNPLYIKQSGGGSIRKVKTDKADAMKIAKYGLDNWVDLREYTPMDTVRQQLKLCSRQYNLYMKTVVSLQNNGVARKGVEAIELKLKGYEATEIAKHYDTSVNNVNAWISRARSKLRNEPALLEILY